MTEKTEGTKAETKTKSKTKAKKVDVLKLKKNHYHAGIMYKAGTVVDEFKKPATPSDIAYMKTVGVI